MNIKTVEEINEMLTAIGKEINRIEAYWSQPEVGRSLWSSQCESSRLKYAGLIAQRKFLNSLKEVAMDEELLEE
jgi:hypothetical protein